MLILFHTICGIIALVSGLVVIGLTKGTKLHVSIGRVYGLSMLILCLTSFFIYELFGGFNGFHIMSIISLLSVMGGVWQAWFKKKGWLRGHYMFMSFSYLGLIMATGSHFFKHLGFALAQLGIPHITVLILCVLILWVIPFVIGRILIYRNWPKFKKEFSKNYA